MTEEQKERFEKLDLAGKLQMLSGEIMRDVRLSYFDKLHNENFPTINLWNKRIDNAATS